MLRDVEMGVNFYKEFGKLEKQLAKYQIKNVCFLKSISLTFLPQSFCIDFMFKSSKTLF
ncbi:hypothetical protein HpMS64_15040 [Helicobacter pylori]